MRLCCFTFKKMQLLTLLLAVAVILGILMILFFFNYPSMVKERIIDQLVFKNNTEAIERLRSTKEVRNLRLTFYLQNVTNPDEVIANGSVKIKIQEIGPFVYNELKIRDFVNNNQTSGLISFKARTIYTFNREASIGDPSKFVITWPNVPLLVAQDVLDNLSSVKRFLAYELINQAIKKNNEPAFIRDSAENFLFKGSKRHLFEYLQGLDIFKLFKPWPLKDNMFALLYGKNNTWDYNKDYIMTASAGFGPGQSYRDLNSYKLLNGSSTMSFWGKNPPNCNEVGGTNGEMFSPFLNRSQYLEVFSMDICRKLKLKYSQDYIVDNINVFKYVLDEKAFSSGFTNPENKCYCLTHSSEGIPGPECNIDGIFDLKTCNNANVFASGGHFFGGSPELLERIDGMSPPNNSLHEPTIYVEPNTGVPIKVKVPLQFNIRMVKNDFNIFNFFQDGQALIIPLVLIEESAEVSQDQAAMLKSKLLLLDSWFISMVLGGSFIFVLVISVIGAILCIRYKDSRIARLGLAAGVPTIAEPDETTPILVAETRSYTNTNIESMRNDEQ